MVTDEKEDMVKVDLDGGDAEEDTEMLADPNIHYGPAPEGKQSRRGVRSAQVSKKEVQLINLSVHLVQNIPLFSAIVFRFELFKIQADVGHRRSDLMGYIRNQFFQLFFFFMNLSILMTVHIGK